MARLAAFILGCAILAMGIAGPSGFAADNDISATAKKKLQDVERELEKRRGVTKNLENKAQRLKRDVVEMRRSLIGAAASVQRQEDKVTTLEQRLSALSAEEAAKSASLKRRRTALADTLGTLARLSRQPPEALIASPSPPVDMVRGSLVLSAVIPEMERRADALSAELSALRNVRREISSKRAKLASASENLSKERIALNRLMKRTARQRTLVMVASAKEKRRMARLAEEAEDLRTLMRKLTEEEGRARQAGVSVAPPLSEGSSFSGERGRLPLPARGRIVTHFGQRSDSGIRSKGIRISTRAAAPVVAPYDGRVVYAGPFRRYGQLLIISHGEGYHTLIAGMSRIDGVVGQWLLAGEPVGHMGRGNNLGPSAGGGSPTLYLELRRENEPINPLPWLAASERKVSG